MHILIILLIVAAILFFYIQISGQGNHSSSSQDLVDTGPQQDSQALAMFISKGNLFIKDKQGQVTQVHSQYVEDLIEKLERSNKTQGWKKNTTWETSFAGMNNQKTEQDGIQAIFTSVVPIDKDNILYFIKDAHFGGLFQYNEKDSNEQRLMHRQNLFLEDLSYSPSQNFVLCTSHHQSGIANIVKMETDANNYLEVTSGDTIDTSPALVDPNEQKIVFQSQGLARDPSGYIIASGPSSINLLDLESGDMSTIFEDQHTDFIKPRVNSRGDLFFIRRPYETFHYSSKSAIFDAIFFPFRLIRAVFHYLNFFSLMYSRKPLTSASGPLIKEDAKALLLKGRRIDAEKAMRQEKRINGVPSLVPSSWELVRCTQDGKQQVIAKNVSSYSISKDDEVFFSNGCGIFQLNENGSATLLLKDNLIEEFFLFE